MQALLRYGISRELILEQGAVLRRWILMVTMAGVPLFFLRSTNDPFNVPKLALLILGTFVAAAVLLAEVTQGARPRAWRAVWLPAVAVGVPLAIAWAFSPYRYWSLFGEYGRFQGLLPYLVVIAFGLLVADSFVGHRRELIWSLVVSGAVVGGYMGLQRIGLDPFTWAQQFGGETTETSTLGNPNFVGGFLAIVLPLTAALWFTEHDDNRRHVWKAAALIGLGLVLSFSQGGYAAAAAGAAVFAGFFFSHRWRRGRLFGALAAAAIAALVLGAVGFAMASPDAGFIPLTTQQRALWWRGALNVASEHPLVGAGPNAYAVEGWHNRPTDDSLTHGFDFSDDTHSVPLAFLTGAGILGLVGYLVLVGWLVRRGIEEEGEDLLAVGLLGAAAAFVVQSLVSIDEVVLRTTLWAILGALAVTTFGRTTKSRSTSKSATTPKKKGRKGKATALQSPGLVLVPILMALLGLWWSGMFVLSDARFGWAQSLLRRGEIEQGQREFARVLGHRGDYHYRHTYGFLLGELAISREVQGRALMEDAQLAYSFTDAFPDLPALRDRASQLARFSEFVPAYRAEAGDLYERVLPLDPYNTVLLSEGMAVLVESRRWETVTDLLVDRIDVVGDRAPWLWGYLARAHAELGEEAEALAAVERALDAEPENEQALEAQRVLDQEN